METLVGTVERITYYNEENGYTVAQVAPEGRAYTVTVVGALMEVSPGENLRLHGQWTTHARYGRQFQVERYATVLPATAAGIEKYLGSGMIKGVGPVTARRIVRRFKLDTLRIIEEEPGRLREVLGVGLKRVAMIQKAWEEHKAIKEVMIFLQSHNVSTSHAVRIYKTYGDASIDVVRSDPYRLARDIHGIGFLTADKIARELGLAHDSPQRVRAGISYTLSQMADDGHVYAPEGELVHESVRILQVLPGLVGQGVQALLDEQELKEDPLTYSSPDDQPPGPSLHEERAIYLPPFFYGEVGVANRFKALLGVVPSRLGSLREAHLDRVSEHLPKQNEPALNEGQRAAVRAALTHKVTVLTGGPGTGKTTAVRAVIRLSGSPGPSLLPWRHRPAGRPSAWPRPPAARPRPSTACWSSSRRQGSTFQRNEENPLEADMIIVDEASMLDLLLTNHLLKAIHPESHLLLVGDVDQLPSVGAGNVLRDIIESGGRGGRPPDRDLSPGGGQLDHRQCPSHQPGRMPLFPREAVDFFLFPAEDAEQAADLVVDLVTEPHPAQVRLRPHGRRPGALARCTGARPAWANSTGGYRQPSIHAADGQSPKRVVGSHLYRPGDRVMQIRNNYDKEVFNGDMGRIVRSGPVNQVLTVRIDEQPVEYEFSELDELVHAYAVSVHKSQGSEYRAVVVPVLTQHYVMLQRNLLYTAVTRAKELVVLVGTATGHRHRRAQQPDRRPPHRAGRRGCANSGICREGRAPTL